MQIVTDSGMDLALPPELMPQTDIHIVRHTITLDGVTYRSGVDIQPAELQQKLMETDSFPVTSQPEADDFARMYRKLAMSDPDILSIHLSAQLSGTLNAAKMGARMVPEARVTFVDTKTLSAVMGWQVAAASRAIKAGWSLDQVLKTIQRIGNASESMYTIDDLKYLIHGGRISHMRALVASVFHIRPIINVDKTSGTYLQLGMARSFDDALHGILNHMKMFAQPGKTLRVQILHAYNPKAAERLHAMIDSTYICNWMPVHHMSPVLAAHTGPTMVGVAFAPQSVFDGLP